GALRHLTIMMPLQFTRAGTEAFLRFWGYAGTAARIRQGGDGQLQRVFIFPLVSLLWGFPVLGGPLLAAGGLFTLVAGALGIVPPAAVAWAAVATAAGLGFMAIRWSLWLST